MLGYAGSRELQLKKEVQIALEQHCKRRLSMFITSNPKILTRFRQVRVIWEEERSIVRIHHQMNTRTRRMQEGRPLGHLVASVYHLHPRRLSSQVEWEGGACKPSSDMRSNQEAEANSRHVTSVDALPSSRLLSSSLLLIWASLLV